MELKDLENHIKKVVHQMPFDLCKLNPEYIFKSNYYISRVRI